MPRKLPLDDGGPLHHPDEPVGFHPSLRAAGHLLVACETVHRGTLRSLRDDVLPHHPHRLPPAATAPTSPLTTALRAWAAERHLASPYVLEALLLTLSAWHRARRRLALVRHDLETLSAHPAGPAAADLLDRLRGLERCCTDALAGWGPWIHLLTHPPADAPVTPLLALGPPLPHLAIPRRTPSPLTLEHPPWNPEIETWEDFETKLRRHLDAALPAYRRRTRSTLLRRGYRPVPVKTAAHHFRWLAERQLRGWRPSQTARRHSVHPATVHAALATLTKLLHLPLRPVKPGPEEL
jgi:hypothetical protein